MIVELSYTNKISFATAGCGSAHYIWWRATAGKVTIKERKRGVLPVTFGEKLQTLRKVKGMSQEQLAGWIEVSRQAVSKWELDESLPDINNILRISEMFGVSTDFLLRDTIEPPEELSNKCLEKSCVNAIQRRSILPLAAGLVVIGLLVSIAGWELWRTGLAVCFGVIIQIVGIILFESKIKGEIDPGKSRCIFYTIACWLILPFPVWWFCAAALRFYPRPYSYLVSLLIPTAVYFLSCGTIVLLMLWRNRRQKKKTA